MDSTVNNDNFQFFYDSAKNALVEVEINIDEDPLEMMLTLPRRDNPWDGLTSPSKHHAIYQNNESTPKYTQQKQPLSYHHPQQQYPHASNLSFSQCPSPLNQPSYQLSNHHQLQSNSQLSPFHRPFDYRPSNPSPLRQNSYPIPQSNPGAFNNRDVNMFYTQMSYSGSQILNRSHQDNQGYKQMEREQERCFHNGFSSSESLPGQSVSRGRGLYSSSSDIDAVYTHLNDDCIISSSESTDPRNTQSHSQSQIQSYTMSHKQSWNKKVSLTDIDHKSKPETKFSLHSNLGPSSTMSGTIDSTAPSPWFDGDKGGWSHYLTSELMQQEHPSNCGLASCFRCW
ncbi:hypothetical protein PAMP_018482 [Pampus punctatissimus]